MIKGIHREGKTTLLIGGILLSAIASISWVYTAAAFAITFTLLCLILLLFLFSFFRVPKRIFRPDDDFILSPCDGKLVVNEVVNESEYVGGKCRQLSIFMSPLNVHINWHPVTGAIAYKKYHAGKYLVAWHPKSSTENERQTLGYRLHNGSVIVIRQIAGALARRIINYGQVPGEVKQCSEMGFIKFGSRVDVFLPLDCEVLVELDQKVVGGVTKLATLN